ncbi:MAG: Na/Pi cotransporter family protein [Clostridiales bacterium]|nr:Na/Pi cotransporter family protein [Clostridiales bacterium]
MTIFNILFLVGGLAMFLFGMNLMSSSLEKISGGKLESILEKMTDSRIKGVILGLFVTAVIQSSGAVTVMAVGFVNSGIMALRQVIGIIMGVNIGTTVTAWLLSLTGIESSNVFINLLNPASFAPILAIIGVVLIFFCKTQRKNTAGYILFGFALLLMGMTQMSDSMSVLEDMPEFTSLIVKFSNPALGILAGFLLTTVLQSSSASVGILQALSSTGAITVSTAFPIILGQNIGSCITVLISSIGANKNAKRTALFHLVFNVIGVVLALGLFYGLNAVLSFPFFDSVVSPASIAVIHSVFNIFATVVLFPFGNKLEKLMYVFIKDDEQTVSETQTKNTKQETPSLPDERFIISPTYALDKVKDKCDEMALLAETNVKMSLEFIKVYSRIKDEKIKLNEKKLDAFEDELETYLIKISAMDFATDDSMRINKYSHAVGNFERIGDYAANIIKTKRKMHKDKIHFSEDANRELEIMSRAVREIMENSVNAFINDDLMLAMSVEPLEQVVDNLKAQLREKHSKRMENGECTIENGMLFFDIINSFERIADHCSNLAVCIIELSQGSYQTHSYLKGIKNSDNKTFMEQFEAYLEKYSINTR